MNRYKSVIQILSLLIVVGLTTSCKKDTIVLDEVSTDLDRTYKFAGPIGTVYASIDDLLNDEDADKVHEFIKENEDGELFLTYKEEINYNWKDVLVVDDMIETWEYDASELADLPTLPLPVSRLKAGEEVITDTINLEIGDAISLESILLYSAGLSITLNNVEDFRGEITLNMPKVTRNGESLATTVKIDGEESYTEPLNQLNGYEIEFETNETYPQGYFIIEIIPVDLEYVGEIPTETPDPISIDFRFTNIVPESAIGQFGNHELDNAEFDFDFTLFEDLDWDGSIQFNDYILQVETTNSFGASIDATINDVLFRENETNIEKSLLLNNNVINISPASIGPPVTPSHNNFKFTKDNSNIEEIGLGATFKPDHISGSIDAILNPDGIDTKNFLTRNDSINTTVHMSVPLFFRTSAYCRNDTFDLDAVDILIETSDTDTTDYSDNLQHLKLHLNVINGLPFEISTQAYLVDENYVRIDSLFDRRDEGLRLIKAAETDDDGTLINKEGTPSYKEIIIEHAQVEKWADEEVMYIILESCGITSDGGSKFVKVNRDNFIKISASIDVAAEYGPLE